LFYKGRKASVNLNKEECFSRGVYIGSPMVAIEGKNIPPYLS